MRAVTVGATVALALLGCSSAEDLEPAPRPATPTATGPAVARSIADLPVGRPPQRVFVVNGISVVFPDRSIDLAWKVEAITGNLVWDEEAGTIHRVGPGAIDLVASEATAPPTFGGKFAWIERGSEIVQQEYRGRSRQPLPDGCCSGATVVGYDFDIDVDLFVTASEGSWMWDTYEGREGIAESEVHPADSEDHFWRVGGTGAGLVAGTGNGSEVLVDYPGDRWGWGHVSGPRDPARDDLIQYEGHERLSAVGVWLTPDAVIVLDQGRLTVLGTRWHNNLDSHNWRALTGESTPFDLPRDLTVASVVSESLQHRRTVLIDATDRAGARAWVRCDVRTYACEVAADLGPDDVVPTR